MLDHPCNASLCDVHLYITWLRMWIPNIIKHVNVTAVMQPCYCTVLAVTPREAF